LVWLTGSLLKKPLFSGSVAFAPSSSTGGGVFYSSHSKTKEGSGFRFHPMITKPTGFKLPLPFRFGVPFLFFFYPLNENKEQQNKTPLVFESLENSEPGTSE
jgi:hypothetical protein